MPIIEVHEIRRIRSRPSTITWPGPSLQRTGRKSGKRSGSWRGSYHGHWGRKQEEEQEEQGTGEGLLAYVSKIRITWSTCPWLESSCPYDQDSQCGDPPLCLRSPASGRRNQQKTLHGETGSRDPVA